MGGSCQEQQNPQQFQGGLNPGSTQGKHPDSAGPHCKGTLGSRESESAPFGVQSRVEFVEVGKLRARRDLSVAGSALCLFSLRHCFGSCTSYYCHGYGAHFYVPALSDSSPLLSTRRAGTTCQQRNIEPKTRPSQARQLNRPRGFCFAQENPHSTEWALAKLFTTFYIIVGMGVLLGC